MAEREVVIKISAKNITEAEFKKVRRGLAGIGSSADGTKKRTAALKEGFRDFRNVAGPALGVVTAAAALTAGAIVGVTIAVIKLGERGSALLAVATSFDRLTAAAGESGREMVNVTSKAAKGLITDLEIMAAANKGLLLGLPITSTSMGRLAETAIVLGKAMGQDASKSLDDLITGLGRASPLILDNLGITVKVGEANSVYAAKLGKTTKQLTDAEKKMAFYEATLAAAGAKVEELGGIQLTFGDTVQQGRVAVTKFSDSLSIMIAKSPGLIAGMQTAGNAISRAFGDDKDAVIKGIVESIEFATIFALEFGKQGVNVAIAIKKGFGVVDSVILGVRFAFSELNTEIAEGTVKTLEVAAVMSGYNETLSRAVLAARSAAEASAANTVSLKEQIVESVAAAAGTDTYGQALQTLKLGLEETQFAIVTGTVVQRESNVAMGEATGHVTGLGTAVSLANFQLQSLGPVFDEYKESLATSGEGTRRWAELVSNSFTSTTRVTKSFGITVSRVGGEVFVQSAKMEAAFARFGLTTRAQFNLTAAQARKDFEIITATGKFSAAELTKLWKAYEDARQKASEETTKFTLDQGASLVAGAAGQFAELGGKFKVFAIAEAVIATFQSVAKTWAQWGWPIGIPFAAAALAVGLATVNKIRSQGFREGTENLDFEDFGPGTQAFLHRREAVIPEGGGHRLGGEIAGELARRQGGLREISMF